MSWEWFLFAMLLGGGLSLLGCLGWFAWVIYYRDGSPIG